MPLPMTAEGLRTHCPDDHLIYWHDVEPGFDYARHGKRGGICTALDVWNQDAAYRRMDAGRLRRAGRPSALISGTGVVKVEWTLYTSGASPRVVVECRRGHVFDPNDLPQPDPSHRTDDYLHAVRAHVESFGWSVDPLVECAEHRAERHSVEGEIERLRESERGASDGRPDGSLGASAAGGATGVRPRGGARSGASGTP